MRVGNVVCVDRYQEEKIEKRERKRKTKKETERRYIDELKDTVRTLEERKFVIENELSRRKDNEKDRKHSKRKIK